MSKDYVGKKCWQARGYTTIKFGTILSQRIDNGWRMVCVKWDNDPITTWEKVNNVSFELRGLKEN